MVKSHSLHTVLALLLGIQDISGNCVATHNCCGTYTLVGKALRPPTSMTSSCTHYGFLMSSIPGKDIQQYALAYQYIQREHIDSQGINQVSNLLQSCMGQIFNWPLTGMSGPIIVYYPSSNQGYYSSLFLHMNIVLFSVKTQKWLAIKHEVPPSTITFYIYTSTGSHYHTVGRAITMVHNE